MFFQESVLIVFQYRFLKIYCSIYTIILVMNMKMNCNGSITILIFITIIIYLINSILILYKSRTINY